MIDFVKRNVLWIAAGILIVQSITYYGYSSAEVIPRSIPWSEFPDRVGEWKQVNEQRIEDAVLSQLKPDDYLNRSYSKDGSKTGVNFFVAYFKTQRTGFAPHSPKNCLPGAGWSSVSSSVLPLPVPGQNSPILVNHYVVSKDNIRMVVLYWYQQGRRSFTNEITAQFYAIPELLLHGRTDSTLIRVIAPAREADAASALDDAKDFAVAAHPIALQHIN